MSINSWSAIILANVLHCHSHVLTGAHANGGVEGAAGGVREADARVSKAFGHLGLISVDRSRRSRSTVWTWICSVRRCARRSRSTASGRKHSRAWASPSRLAASASTRVAITSWISIRTRLSTNSCSTISRYSCSCIACRCCILDFVLSDCYVCMTTFDLLLFLLR